MLATAMQSNEQARMSTPGSNLVPTLDTRAVAGVVVRRNEHCRIGVTMVWETVTLPDPHMTFASRRNYNAIIHLAYNGHSQQLVEAITHSLLNFSRRTDNWALA